MSKPSGKGARGGIQLDQIYWQTLQHLTAAGISAEEERERVMQMREQLLIQKKYTRDNDDMYLDTMLSYLIRHEGGCTVKKRLHFLLFNVAQCLFTGQQVNDFGIPGTHKAVFHLYTLHGHFVP